MTDAHHLFSTYSPRAGNLKVKIIDGTLSLVAGKGSIRISKSITLNHVLHVHIYLAICCLLASLPNSLIAQLNSYPFIVFFKTYHLGRRLAMLRNVRVYITSMKLMCLDNVLLLFVILHLILRTVNFCYGTKGWVILVFST